MRSTTLHPVTLGVEEEFQVADARGHLVSRAEDLLADLARPGAGPVHGAVTQELPLSQVETVTGVCATLAELDGELRALRCALTRSGGRTGLGLLASSSPPLGSRGDQALSAVERYVPVVERMQVLAREQFITGMHVHLGLPPAVEAADPDLRAVLLDGLRPWLAVLTALSANSPFWFGEDTGFASFRTVNWSRWPVTGPPPRSRTLAGWHAAVDRLVSAGVVDDASFAYWDARVALHHPTVEVRCADVVVDVEEAVALAGLLRGLASVLVAAAGDEAPDHPVEALRAASWRAARHGLDGDLVDPVRWVLRPAEEVVRSLLERARPGLEAHGDTERVSTAVEGILRRGNGAQRQRRAYSSGGFAEVLDLVTVREGW